MPHIFQLISRFLPPPGGETPPERGTFLGFWVVCERVGILLVEVYKRVGKSVIWVCEMAQRARTD